jgi:glycosyltransferase involved in cell wall biosynthesis
MPKTLAIAGQLRPTQMVGGVASHLQNLCRGIEEVIADDERFADVTVDVFHGPAGTPYRTRHFSYHAMSHRCGRFAADAWFGMTAAKDFDATLFTNYFRPPIVRSGRSVCVIHDLLDKHFPELSSWARRVWLDRAQRYALSRCDRVIAISQAVRDDILRAYGARLADKVTAIWNPIAFERLDGVDEQRFTNGKPFVLGVAVDRPSKNLYTLIRAFEKLSRRDADHLLVLVGELRSRRPQSRIHSRRVASTMPPTVDLVRELGVEDRVIITGFVSDAELGALYRGASLFVMPSIFEGFGMPPIEALAMGVPTLVSGIAVLREITLGAAEYLDDPRDADAMAERMYQMLSLGDAMRPAADVVSAIRRTFAPATVATRYLEALFDLPARTAPVDVSASRRAAAATSG